MKIKRIFIFTTLLILFTSLLGVVAALTSPMQGERVQTVAPDARFATAVAFDVSPALRDVVSAERVAQSNQALIEIRPDRGAVLPDQGFSGDGAIQTAKTQQAALAIPGTIANFEGLSNQDNFNIFGGRVNPPDPVGDVGPNHYVEMINLVFAVYDKTGNLLLGPMDTGALWAGFAVPDCTDPSGDPIVIYDQFVDRWLLTQFTTSGLSDPTRPFWNCVAISTSGDPTGTYYRYAFETENF